MATISMAQKDYLSQLLEDMREQMNRLERKQDNQSDTLGQIKEQTLKTNGRVTKLEGEMVDVKTHQSGGFRFLEKVNSKTLYILAVGAVLLMLLIFKIVYKVDLTNLL